VVVSHPGGGVKEQTAGTYVRKLAEKGFVTIAYDASYQGESTGELRQLENPYIRTEDVSAAIDYLTTLPYVDAARIGAMGICAGAGYTANAAINDRRIKAAGTVSAVNIGSMFRNGWENNIKGARRNTRIGRWIEGAYGRGWRCSDGDDPARAVAQGRCSEQGARRSLGVLPHAAGAISDSARFCDGPQSEPDHHLRCLQQGGSVSHATPAGHCGKRRGEQVMSDDLYKRTASKKKSFHVVEGANHMSLYDVPKYVDAASSVLGSFFKDNL
jgi:fermentation-respiration switch protein FrsA (DUF1100 family)